MEVATFQVPAPHTATQIVYQTTSPAELADRIKDATIIISTTVKLTAAALDPLATPNLMLIAQQGTGYDNVDIEACRKRGIRVCNTSGGNGEAVSEHALALFFSIRRSVPLMHDRVIRGEFKQKGSLTSYMRDGKGNAPMTLKQEIVGIIGYGKVGRLFAILVCRPCAMLRTFLSGKKVTMLLKGLGVKVLVLARKTEHSINEGMPFVENDFENPRRTAFQYALHHCTAFILTCPLTEDTRNLISTSELESMTPSTVIINVARGGVVDEAAMVKALNSKSIAGYATDVFSKEPAGPGDIPILDELNDDAHFIATPHVAWFSETTLVNLSKILADNVELWLAGTPQNVVV